MDAVTYALAKKFAAKNYGNRFVRALGNRLAGGIEPAAILVQGDSTGNGINEWPYLMGQWLGSKYPAYSVNYRLWDDTNQSYGDFTDIQTGAAGEAYANLPGVKGSYISTTDKASLDIVGDIDIIVKAASADWTASALVVKFDAAPQRSWGLFVDESGRPYFWYSTDGTAYATRVSTAAISYADGVAGWVRCTVDVDNGAAGHDVKFYTSTDGKTWTQLGKTITTAGVIALYSSSSLLNLGQRGQGAGSDVFSGKIYKAIVKSGIDGTVVASFDAGQMFPAGSTGTDAEGNVWTANGTSSFGNGAPSLTILNTSVAGKAIAYSTDATSFALQAAKEPHLAFINYSHNDGATVDYQATYEGLCTQLLTAWPNVGVVCTAQNPQVAPEVNIVAHARRCLRIAALAAKNNYGLIDVYRAFVEYGTYTGLMTDGCHPNAAGQAVWLNEVKKFLLPATK